MPRCQHSHTPHPPSTSPRHHLTPLFPTLTHRYGQLELTWGSNLTQWSDPWPEVKGIWDPYVLKTKQVDEFPVLLVVTIVLIVLAVVVTIYFIDR